MTTTERLCIDCERRPLPKDGAQERCRLCLQRFESEQQDQKQAEAERKTRRKWTEPSNMCRYTRVFLWKYHLVGYTPGVTEDGRVFANPGFFYLQSGPTEKELAKLGRKLVDMNIYQPGFDGAWVKRFKAMLKAAKCREGEALTWKES